MHKAGFVNIVGNPNVGKSTLMNQLVGERISIATFKAQTTRHRIMGIVNDDDCQIVFSDTPGVLKPNYKMQEMMLAFSESALADADVLLYVTDVVENPEKNADFLAKVAKMTIPVLLLINKIDQSDQKTLGDIVERWHALLPNAEILPVSAKNKFGTAPLMKRIKELLPESPAYFGKDQLTDKPARFFVSEIIREKILLYYDKEIPYSVEVAVEQIQGDRHQYTYQCRHLCGARLTERHRNRASGRGAQEGKQRGAQGPGEVLRQENLPRGLCQGRQGLAQLPARTEQLRV